MELQVLQGTAVACRLFDIADAVDLAEAEQVWSRLPRPAITRGRLVTALPKAVSFGVAPLDIPLDPIRLPVAGVETQLEASVRLYDFGVARLSLRLPADGLPWTEFTERVNALDRAVSDGAIWQSLLDRVREVFAPALLKPSRSEIEEDYLIAYVRRFSEAQAADALLERVDLIPLLSGETRALSDGARRDLLRQKFSYYVDDLVVLTWDRAFIYEPRDDSDVMDVLDVANAQFLEMRYYDQLLDAELPRMYDLVEAMQRTRPLLSSRRFADLARRLYSLVAEVTELREKVDNALQVTEDVYLARIYTAALELFRVASISAAVDHKLAIIRDTYAALYEEASARRAALMEAAIVILIVAEIVLALLHRN